MRFTPTVVNSSVLIVATYMGGSTTAASGGTHSLAVTQRTSRVAVTCVTVPAAGGSLEHIKCKARVSGYGPTGNVTWTVPNGTGAVSLPEGETCSLNNKGTCTVKFTGTLPGTVVIQATYSGDTNNKGSVGTRNLTIK